MKILERLLKKSLLVLSIGLCAVSTAQATNGIFATLESGTGSQSNLPSTSNEYDPINHASSLTSSLTPLAWRVSLGYNFDLFRYLGFGVNIGEGVYGNSVYHYPDGATTTVRSEVLDILAQFTIHIQKFDVIPKIGGARETTRVTGRNAQPRDHYNNLETGIELAYNISQRFAVTATYAHVYGGDPESVGYISQQSVPIDEYLLGLRYTFASS